MGQTSARGHRQRRANAISLSAYASSADVRCIAPEFGLAPGSDLSAPVQEGKRRGRPMTAAMVALPPPTGIHSRSGYSRPGARERCRRLHRQHELLSRRCARWPPVDASAGIPPPRQFGIGEHKGAGALQDGGQCSRLRQGTRVRRWDAGWWRRHQRPKRWHHGGQEFALLGRPPGGDDHASPGANHASELAHGSRHVSGIENTVHCRDRIEAGVREGQSLKIALPHVGRGQTLPRDRQQPR